MNRMVTKGYQKGVYERVTKGPGRPQRSAGNLPAVPRASSPSAPTVLRCFGASRSNMNTLFGANVRPCIFEDQSVGTSVTTKRENYDLDSNCLAA
jgi:hypothetical protein